MGLKSKLSKTVLPSFTNKPYRHGSGSSFNSNSSSSWHHHHHHRDSSLSKSQEGKRRKREPTVLKRGHLLVRNDSDGQWQEASVRLAGCFLRCKAPGRMGTIWIDRSAAAMTDPFELNLRGAVIPIPSRETSASYYTYMFSVKACYTSEKDYDADNPPGGDDVRLCACEDVLSGIDVAADGGSGGGGGGGGGSRCASRPMREWVFAADSTADRAAWVTAISNAIRLAEGGYANFEEERLTFAIAMRMARELEVRKRVYHLRTYDECFLGEDAISWLQCELKGELNRRGRRRRRGGGSGGGGGGGGGGGASSEEYDREDQKAGDGNELDEGQEVVEGSKVIGLIEEGEGRLEMERGLSDEECSLEEAKEFGDRLITLGLVYHVAYEHHELENKKLFYRFCETVMAHAASRAYHHHYHHLHMLPHHQHHHQHRQDSSKVIDNGDQQQQQHQQHEGLPPPRPPPSTPPLLPPPSPEQERKIQRNQQLQPHQQRAMPYGRPPMLPVNGDGDVAPASIPLSASGTIASSGFSTPVVPDGEEEAEEESPVSAYFSNDSSDYAIAGDVIQSKGGGGGDEPSVRRDQALRDMDIGGHSSQQGLPPRRSSSPSSPSSPSSRSRMPELPPAGGPHAPQRAIEEAVADVGLLGQKCNVIEQQQRLLEQRHGRKLAELQNELADVNRHAKHLITQEKRLKLAVKFIAALQMLLFICVFFMRAEQGEFHRDGGGSSYFTGGGGGDELNIGYFTGLRGGEMTSAMTFWMAGSVLGLVIFIASLGETEMVEAKKDTEAVAHGGKINDQRKLKLKLPVGKKQRLNIQTRSASSLITLDIARGADGVLAISRTAGFNRGDATLHGATKRETGEAKGPVNGEEQRNEGDAAIGGQGGGSGGGGGERKEEDRKVDKVEVHEEDATSEGTGGEEEQEEGEEGYEAVEDMMSTTDEEDEYEEATDSHGALPIEIGGDGGGGGGGDDRAGESGGSRGGPWRVGSNEEYGSQQKGDESSAGAMRRSSSAVWKMMDDKSAEEVHKMMLDTLPPVTRWPQPPLFARLSPLLKLAATAAANGDGDRAGSSTGTGLFPPGTFLLGLYDKEDSISSSGVGRGGGGDDIGAIEQCNESDDGKSASEREGGNRRTNDGRETKAFGNDDDGHGGECNGDGDDDGHGGDCNGDSGAYTGPPPSPSPPPKNLGNYPYVPINQPESEDAFEFESRLFKGRLILKVADLEVNEDRQTRAGVSSYFRGRKRRFMCCVQGEFKERLPFTRVYTGQRFIKPFRRLPPKWLLRSATAIVRRLSPAMRLDVVGEQPYFLAPLAATAQEFRVEQHCDFERLTVKNSVSITEETTLLGRTFLMSNHLSGMRKRYFSNLRNLEEYCFEPGLTYTMTFYQHMLDLVPLHMDLGFKRIDLSGYIDSQPIQIMSQDIETGEYLWNVEIWHANLIPKKKEGEDGKKDEKHHHRRRHQHHDRLGQRSSNEVYEVNE